MFLTAEILRSLLQYDENTGRFIRLVTRANRAKVGEVAGAPDERGYVRIGVMGRGYRAHRLAWLYVHGEWPPSMLDHINGDLADNRIVNLRLADSKSNGANCRRRVDNKSGFKGVHWCNRQKRWVARITRGNRTRFLGEYETPELAHSAYWRAAQAASGEFARAA